MPRVRDQRHGNPERSRTKRRARAAATPEAAAPKRDRRSVLSAEQKLLIVQRLAHWVQPTIVQDELKTRFGIEVPLTTIIYYDPATACTDLSKKWRAVFNDARDRYVSDTNSIAIAHRKVRIQELWSLYEIDKKRGATALAAQHLAQIAKELGGAFTNRHVVESADPAAELAKMLGMARDDVLGALGAGE